MDAKTYIGISPGEIRDNLSHREGPKQPGHLRDLAGASEREGRNNLLVLRPERQHAHATMPPEALVRRGKHHREQIGRPGGGDQSWYGLNSLDGLNQPSNRWICPTRRGRSQTTTRNKSTSTPRKRYFAGKQP